MERSDSGTAVDRSISAADLARVLLRTARPTVRSVILDEADQRALAWLLRTTDNGGIVSGADATNMETLRGIQKRLGKPL
jgi:hypothetical protein